MDGRRFGFCLRATTSTQRALRLIGRRQRADGTVSVPTAERVVGRNICMYWHKVWFVPEPTREGLDGLASLGETKIFLRSQFTERQDFPPQTMGSGGRPGVEVGYCWLSLRWVSWCRAVAVAAVAMGRAHLFWRSLDFLAVREADRLHEIKCVM